MSSLWQYLKLTWAGNLYRIVTRTVCCEQRHRWSPSLVTKVRESTDNKCFYCRCVLNVQGNLQSRMHVDHYWPWSKGGANLFPNLVPACARCNLRKSNQRAVVFVERNASFTRPFCRNLDRANKYCTVQPGRGYQYCRKHGLLHMIC